MNAIRRLYYFLDWFIYGIQLPHDGRTIHDVALAWELAIIATTDGPAYKAWKKAHK